MADRNKDSGNNQQKFDNSALKSDISERRHKESTTLETTSSQRDINRRKDVIYKEMNTSSKDKHSRSPQAPSTLESEIPRPRHSSKNSADRDILEKLETATDIIPSSSEKANDSSSIVGASAPCSNAFANDGSFMAIFRKKVLEEQMNKESKTKGVKRPVETEEIEKTSPKPGSSFNLPLVGRRKGPKMLKTGIVAKKVQEDEEEDSNPDAWSKYLAEVRKYKSQKCIEDDGGSTPLVK